MSDENDQITRSVQRSALGIPTSWTARRASGGEAVEMPELPDITKLPGISLAKIELPPDACYVCNRKFDSLPPVEITVDESKEGPMARCSTCSKPESVQTINPESVS